MAEQQFCKLRVGGSIPSAGSTSPESPWARTKITNLVRYKSSGVYFCRAMVGGRLVRVSLKTKSLELAEIKLRKLLASERTKAKIKREFPHTVESFAHVFLTKVRASGVKERSAKYREETWGMVARTCDGIGIRVIADISREDCEAYAAALRSKYSGGRFNGCLETLRGIFKTALSAGACVEDPTINIERAPIKIEAPKLPSGEQFKVMLNTLDGHGRKHPAAFTVRLLAFTGLRINEARHLSREDVDLSKGLLTVRVTKNGDTRRVPIIQDAQPVLQQFIDGAEVIDPRRALRSASNKTMTPHDLRHLFATRCLESGVDVRTVAGWLGHKDGGALLLRRYAHLRDEHSKEMAKKVKFI